MSFRYITNGQSIKKQLILNKLSIPDVLINIIKDFLFYDRITSLAIRNKSRINYLIENVEISRVTMDDHESEEWYFGFFNIFNLMGAKNCFACGEYKTSNRPISLQIECDCMPPLIPID